jgi:hypothetical protein
MPPSNKNISKIFINYYLLEIKSVVVYFQGKAFNPEWKITGHFFVYHLVDMTKLRHQKSHKQDIGGRAS